MRAGTPRSQAATGEPAIGMVTDRNDAAHRQRASRPRAQRLQGDIAKWGPLVKAAKIEPQ
jgi:hypothetical protein